MTDQRVTVGANNRPAETVLGPLTRDGASEGWPMRVRLQLRAGDPIDRVSAGRKMAKTPPGGPGEFGTFLVPLGDRPGSD